MHIKFPFSYYFMHLKYLAQPNFLTLCQKFNSHGLWYPKSWRKIIFL